jgi:hypothetical protein
MITSIETVPKLHGLPVSLPRESAVEIEVEEGVLVFRVSKLPRKESKIYWTNKNYRSLRMQKKQNSTAMKKLTII